MPYLGMATARIVTAMADTGSDSRRPISARDGVFLGLLGAATSFVFVLLLGGLVLGMGFSPSDDERAVRAEVRSQSLGEGDVARLYATRCASCHGPTGQGLIGPSFARVSTRLTVDEHIAVVRNGRNNMPAFAGLLLDAQIEAVVDYERTVLDGSE